MQVQLSDISKEFHSLRGRIPALTEINLQVSNGEFFVLLGPSGCGKSTLLNLVAGLEKPTTGTICFDDKPVADVPNNTFWSPKQRNIAFVFQSYALYPHLNVFDNIAFPLRIARMKSAEIRRAVRDAAGTLQISELLAAKPAELSGGQRQRVAIARAIVRKPNVFLLDEPLSNLDAQLRTSMRAELKSLQNRLGITTIYVTHNQVEALSLGHRVAVLRAGCIEQIGTPQELYDAPATPFVARFIGSPPMNMIQTSLRESAGRLFVSLGEQDVEIPTPKFQIAEALKAESFLLGIRPEHISLDLPENPQTLQARIDSVQPLGRETLLDVSTGSCRLLVLTNRTDLQQGRQIKIRFDFGLAHVFKAHLPS